MLSIKVKNVIPLSNMRLLVFFENGVIKTFDVKPIIKDFPEFETLCNIDLFNLVQVEAGGYGISWNSELDCSEGELWDNGVEIPLSFEDFVQFVKINIVNTNEATDILNCTRQNIEGMVKRGKLKPVKEYQRTKLFLKSDIFTIK